MNVVYVLVEALLMQAAALVEEELSTVVDGFKYSLKKRLL